MATVVKDYVQRNPDARSMVWAHDSHVAAYILPPPWEPETNTVAMGENLKHWYGDSYYCVAQLFGSGYFTAALIHDDGSAENSKLVPHYASPAPEWFYEHDLTQQLTEPTFLKGPDFSDLFKKDEAKLKRALGWGVKPAVMHDENNIMYVDIRRAYDAVTFFPTGTATHLLAP